MTEEIKEVVKEEPTEAAVPNTEAQAPEPNDEAKAAEEPVKEAAPAPDKEADAKEEESPKEDESKESEDTGYLEYDSPVLQQAVSILKAADISAEDANAIFAEAATSGDLSKIDTTTLEERLGKGEAAIVLALAESHYGKEFSEMKAIKESAHALTGGEDNYNAMKDWAAEQSKADPEFATMMTEIREMVDSRQPRAVKAAVRELFDLYRQDPNTTIPADLQIGDSVPKGGDVTPTTRADYTKALNAAHKAGTYEKDRPAIWARRQAGMKQGI